VGLHSLGEKKNAKGKSWKFSQPHNTHIIRVYRLKFVRNITIGHFLLHSVQQKAKAIFLERKEWEEYVFEDKVKCAELYKNSSLEM
jgi:hypothetical protein